jgi:DivIVA domain-containing protein
VALDRQSIEKKDFPIARRGYDPEAVDAHLERLSAEVEALQAEAAAAPAGGAAPSPTPRSSPASLAIAASEQVRAIVEAAEASAASIEAGARDEAERIRAEAQAAAQSTRDDAVARSQDHVGAVGEATSAMLQRVGAMEGEIGTLIESLRTGANRLGADLSLLTGNMGELYDAAGGAPAGPATPAPPIESMPLPPQAAEPVEVAAEPAPDAEEEEEPRSLPPIPEEAPDPSPHEEAPVIPPGLFTATEPVPAAEDRSGSVLDEPYAEPVPESDAAPEAAAGEGDIDGARLIALNMALNGASREETDAYLRDNFDLPDRGALVDEAFATVEG